MEPGVWPVGLSVAKKSKNSFPSPAIDNLVLFPLQYVTLLAATLHYRSVDVANDACTILLRVHIKPLRQTYFPLAVEEQHKVDHLRDNQVCPPNSHTTHPPTNSLQRRARFVKIFPPSQTHCNSISLLRGCLR
jgi:hypothetical protein